MNAQERHPERRDREEPPESARSILRALREGRGFDVEHVLAAKVDRIHAWLRASALDSVVLGLSGGVDSATVLALLLHAKRQEGSPIRRVVALLLPIASQGATNQDGATARGRLVARALEAEHWEAPIGDALAAVVRSLEAGASKHENNSGSTTTRFDAWSEGQCLSVMRTPALYGAAALLQSQGFRSIVAGTTNRDEGSYLGFFGKASDAMVDLQPISDLHKSEVRLLARRLNVPTEIIDAVPSGDVFDGRVDEEMIGASYDDVELFVRLREIGRDPRPFMDERAYAAIERMHAHNRHKYLVGNPAVHLDVLPRGVPDGWTDVVMTRGPIERAREETPPPPEAIPGFWAPPAIALDACATRLPSRRDILLTRDHHERGAFACVIEKALTVADCARLEEAMRASGAAEEVGVTGIKGLRDAYGIGSTRATGWSPELAAALFERIRPCVPSVRFVRDDGFTDGFAIAPAEGVRGRFAHARWRLVGLTPLLRFMRYEPGGRHLCHYDAAYDYGDGRRTLLSVVFYLSDAPKSGATRFVRDRNGQETQRTHLRDFRDWDRDTRDDEVIARAQPAKGDVLVFDHRLCHDVERWDGPGDRVIIRADVVYEAIPPIAETSFSLA